MGLTSYYIPSRKLSTQKDYNIYLNKLHDAWEASPANNITVSFSIILIKKGDDSAFEDTLNNLNKYAPSANLNVCENENVQEIIQNISNKKSWFIYLREGDEIFPWTLSSLQEIILSNKQTKAILFDHDSKENNNHYEPHLKSYFNKRYLLEYDLIKNGICFDSESLYEIGKSKYIAINDALYAWLITKELKDFDHIQKPLLSQLVNYSADYLEIISNQYPQESINVKEFNNRREIIFQAKTTPKVSIIIPFRNKPELLKNCIDSIIKFTVYSNYEIILADNNSEEKETLELLKELIIQHKFIRHLIVDCEFNFSYINNQAVEFCDGDLLLFLNNDTEVLHKAWLQNMVGELQQEGIGAVGAQLLYEDRTIQHAGVVPGIGHVAGHIFRGFERNHKLSMHNIQVAQEVAAVTGACLLTTKAIFTQVKGFDDVNLKIAYNDVDLCLKILLLGLNVMYLPHSYLLHYESKSRNFDLSSGEKKRYDLEVNYMKQKHSELLSSYRFYHPALSNHKEDYSYRLQGEK